MDVVDFGAGALPAGESVVTIGVYDGVHIGHRFTLGEVVSAASATGRRSVVATFEPHPAAVLRPDRAPAMLCDLEQRLELLEEIGIDKVAVIPFTPARAQETPEAFFEEMLVDKLGAAEVIVGDDFHFGKGRSGNIELLAHEGARHGVAVRHVHLEAADGDVVSSTRIRGLVREGEMLHTARLLGRVHELRGRVVQGDGRGGSELGYPTANVEVEENLAVPGLGIYAGWYRDEQLGPIPAAISVGKRPTFYKDGETLIEAYLLDFDGDLYDRVARVSFLHRLRGEERFERLEELKAQMALDVAEARLRCDAHADRAPGSA